MNTACCIAGFLYIHAEVNHVDDDLDMRLWLQISAHDTKRHDRFTVLHHEARDQGMERALAGCIDVGMSFFHRKG